MRVAAVPAARLLLDASIGDIEELLVQSFTDDESAHDDEMQARLAHDFASAFESAKRELSAKYGQPSRVRGRR